MKKLYAAVWLLLAAGVAGSAALLAFMPDIIPAHYNFAGEVDRSKPIAIDAGQDGLTFSN